MFRPNFDDAAKVQVLNVEDALTVAKYPTSGNFIDVSQFQRFVFLVCLGGLDSAVAFAVHQAAAVNGTTKAVTGAAKTIGTDDDDKWFSIEVETRKLDLNNDYRYVTLDVSAAAGSNDYGAIIFIGYGASELPVVQPAGYYDAIVVAG